MREIAPTAQQEADGPAAAAPDPVRRPARRRTGRRLVYAAVPLAAAVVTVAVTGFPGTAGSGNGDRSDHSATGPGVQSVASSGAPVVNLLGQIAAVAAAKPLPAVRDNQFVYVKSEILEETDTQNSSGYHPALTSLHSRQIWNSVDDSRPGLLRENGQDTVLPVATATPPGVVVPTGSTPQQATVPNINAPDYRYLASLPTDPKALLKKIYTETANEGPDRDSEAFTTIGDLLRDQIAPPAVTAALYQAAGMIPGVRVIGDVVDLTGRHDVAVAFDNPIARNEWLFDAKSLDFVGEQTVSLKAGPLGAAGKIVGTELVLDREIVDRAGEVPPPTAG